MRFIYCDAALQSYLGHYAPHCRSIAGGFRALGVQTFVFAHKEIEASLAQVVGAQRLFSCSPYARTSDDPLAGWLKCFSDVSDAFVGDLSRINGLQAEDIVFYDTATPPAIMGISRWIQTKFTPDTCPRIFAGLAEHSGITAEQLPDGTQRLYANGSEPILYRYVSLMLPPAYSQDYRFVTYDASIAEVYSELMGRQVFILPHPFEATTSRQRPSNLSPLTVGFIGAQRESKGFHLVPEIVRKVVDRVRDVRIVVQNSRGSMQREMTYLAEMAARDTRIETIHETLNENSWSALLERCDLLVAPYDRRQYAISGSGITFEGLANGIPIVIPSGTGMERALKEYGSAGSTFGLFTPDSIVEAIVAALAQYSTLAGNAARASETWRQRNGPLKVADAIIRLCGT